MGERKLVPFKKGLFRTSEETGTVELIGVKCRACGRQAFPFRTICIFCHSKEVEETPLSRRGVLHTFTICRVPVPFTTPPYAIGYVDLPEGVRIFSQLCDWKEGELRIGMAMELVLDRLRTDGEGNEIVTYKFRPIPETLDTVVAPWKERE